MAPAADEHRIATGVRGWLEHPASAALPGDSLLVSGWAFADDARVAAVHAEGPWGRQALACGLQRDDVARAYPEAPHAAQAGFSGAFACPARPSTVTLRVVASLDNGRTVELFRRRMVRPSVLRRRLRAAAEAVAVRWRASRPADPLTLARRASARRRSEARASLDAFLRSGSRLSFAAVPDPVVSAIVVAWNQAELTFTCLESLRRQAGPSLEVIVIDNASTDDTPALLDRVDGVVRAPQDENLGFTRGANAGARLATGEYLLFVNSDAELAPGAFAALVASARRPASIPIGAVGGALVFQSGALQEAGAIIWRDGSCQAYGRGADPAAPEYTFERPVDFCSAALLLTPRSVFEDLGGFEERFSPGYYEDVDYCARVWQRGCQVRFEPRAVARHHEFGSAGARNALRLQRERRPIFVERHRAWLEGQSAPGVDVRAARSHPHGRPAVVLVDDAAPDPRRGSGFPRTAALVRALGDLGCEVTVFGTAGDSPPGARDACPGIEIVPGSPGGIGPFVTSRLAAAPPGSLLVVSRPHNVQYLRANLDLPTLAVPWIYDAEAIFSDRDVARASATGAPLDDVERERRLREELRLARGAAAVLVVSERDRRVFAASGFTNVSVAGHAVEPQPTPRLAADRDAILFVGAFGPDSPNEDAARYLAGEIRRALAGTAAERAPIVIAGAALPPELAADFPDIDWLADCEDLSPLYDRARVFVAPSRWAAGIPLKVVEAAARGVPVVCTSLLADELGWTDGQELLTADDADGFARAIARLFVSNRLWSGLRDAALARVAREHGPATFRAGLVSAMETARRAAR